MRNKVFRTEQQNASSSDNILGHGRMPVSDHNRTWRRVSFSYCTRIGYYRISVADLLARR